MDDRKLRELFARLIRTSGMGEIRVNVVLQNAVDILRAKDRKLPKSKIRKARAEAIVDTGAVMTLLPAELVKKLGLSVIDRRTVSLANDQKIELDCAAGLVLTIGDRTTFGECLVGPVGCEPLVGQIVMESLDLIADPGRRTLTPRPESPFQPMIKMKSAELVAS